MSAHSIQSEAERDQHRGRWNPGIECTVAACFAVQANASVDAGEVTRLDRVATTGVDSIYGLRTLYLFVPSGTLELDSSAIA